MLKTIDSHFAEIESGKANIKNTNLLIKKLSETAKKGVFLQVLRAEAICSPEQFWFAAKHSVSAQKEGTAFSPRMEIELLLRITTTRQINRAVEIAGVRDGAQEVVILGLALDKSALETEMKQLEKEIDFKNNKALLEQSAKKNRAALMKAFGITEGELQALKGKKGKALENAIIEKIALNALNQ